MVRSKWKTPYIHYSIIDSILKQKSRSIITTKSRSTFILKSFIGIMFAVYTGRSFTKVFVEERMIGHKLGEFAFTRKVGNIHQKRVKIRIIKKK